jgi:HEPN domain-containing protein
VDKNKRRIFEGWIEKASNHLDSAREFLKSYTTISESIQASQVCVELSVKGILGFLDIDFPPAHGWDGKQLMKMAKQIQEKGLIQRLTERNLNHYIRLPRLLVLVNFWDEFYLQAKYGFEAGYLAPPQDLFQKDDAELAVKHADECLRAALQIRCLQEEQLTALVS